MENKKQKLRRMRLAARDNEDGTVSTHVLSWTGDPSKKRGNFGVFPTIAPKSGKETSTKKEDWTEQSPSEAESKGEMIHVKTKRRAERLAAGSWKKGEARRESMREYRLSKKQ